MASVRKCANAACNCIPEGKEKYCSAHCEGIGDRTEIVCTCYHDGCVEKSAPAPTASTTTSAPERTRL
jgi:hypothetical protein